MRRVLFTLIAAMLGMLLFLGLPILMALVLPGSGPGHHGEDVAGRMLFRYIVVGGLASGLMGGWIGYVASARWRRAAGMAGAVLLVSVVLMLVKIDLGMTKPENETTAIIGIWAFASVVLAAGAGRWAARRE